MTNSNDNSAVFLDKLFAEIQEKASNSRPNESYTAYLAALSDEEIGKKLLEETFELTVANMNLKSDARIETVLEAADVLYHIMALLASKNINFSEVIAELQKRSEQKSVKESQL